MKRVQLLDTSIGTSNIGDFIIMECVRKELATILDQPADERHGHCHHFRPDLRHPDDPVRCAPDVRHPLQEAAAERGYRR